MIKESEFFVQILPAEKPDASQMDGVKPATTKQ
jgi:hypothetical protein